MSKTRACPTLLDPMDFRCSELCFVVWLAPIPSLLRVSPLPAKGL